METWALLCFQMRRKRRSGSPGLPHTSCGRTWVKWSQGHSGSPFAAWLWLSASSVGWGWKWEMDFWFSAELPFLTDPVFLHVGSSDRSGLSSLTIVQVQLENRTWHVLTLLAKYLRLDSGCISLRGYKGAVEPLEHMCFLTLCTRAIFQLISVISFIARFYYILKK